MCPRSSDSCRLPTFGTTTKFAPAERASEAEVRAGVEDVAANPLVTALLDAFDGFVLILNPERQLLAANYALLRRLGVDSPESVIGFRHGEALDCVHAFECDGGCGTSEACVTCGALAALLASKESGTAAERECLMTVRKGEATESLELAVRATPMTIGGRPCTVVCLRDIGDAKRRKALEQVFFHDILNTVGSLAGYAHSLNGLAKGSAAPEVAKVIDRIAFLTDRLASEVRDQRALLEAENGTLEPSFRPVAAGDVIEAVKVVLAGHKAAAEKRLELPVPRPGATIVTDPALLERVLINMTRNAFEATRPGGSVRLWAQCATSSCTFSVWNEGVIAPSVALRIFRRSFTTKNEVGRGLGTYGMKLFGERYLGGKVSFTSTEQEGTVFSIRLPPDPRPAPGRPAGATPPAA